MSEGDHAVAVLARAEDTVAAVLAAAYQGDNVHCWAEDGEASFSSTEGDSSLVG